jgi:hypothetical protein
MRRYGASCIPRAGSAHDERYTMVVAEARDSGDLGGIGGYDDEVRSMALLERILTVRRQRGGVVTDIVGSDDVDEGCGEGWRHSVATQSG